MIEYQLFSRRIFWSSEQQIFVGDLETTSYENIPTQNLRETLALSYNPIRNILYILTKDGEKWTISQLDVASQNQAVLYESSRPITSLSSTSGQLMFSDDEGAKVFDLESNEAFLRVQGKGVAGMSTYRPSMDRREGQCAKVIIIVKTEL